MTPDERWVVVGAGSAGCVVAHRLVAGQGTAGEGSAGEEAVRHVTVVEAGPDLVDGEVPPAIAGPDFFAALAVPGRRFDDLHAVRAAGVAPTPYDRGRGVGGSSAVNAMVALRGSPSLYRSWGWDDVDERWDDVRLPVTTASDGELGPLDRALLAAAPDAGPAPLTRRGGRRVTSAEAYLWPVRERLEVVAERPVDRIVHRGGRVRGVRLVDGAELDATHVVLCAGAIHTPAVLQRSGLGRAGVGDALQDHPSAPIALELADGVRSGPGTLAVATLLTRGDVQYLPLNHLGAGTPAGLGLLLVALMRPRGAAGTVRAVPDPSAPPAVEFGLLADPRDVARLRSGVHVARELLASPGFADIVTAAYVDDHGTRLESLADDDAIERWLRSSCGDYVHAAGSCGIGRALDDDGAVPGVAGLYVADASAFPHIPDVNTHLPTTMLAERLVRRWSPLR